MRSPDLQSQLSDVLADRQLLAHPFYQRWQAGELAKRELTHYAEQYRHFEGALPVALGAIAGRLQPGSARDLVEANLRDELTAPRPHVELFEDFASAVGAAGRDDAEATAATTSLVSLYERSSTTDPMQGLAVIAAYELQAAAIASSKAAGLRLHYGIDGSGAAFWDVHAELEADHASWTLAALASADDRDTIISGALASADAWWSFLDEREAAAAVKTEAT
jgi:pyrroloquinoline-quinone synthase